ncbi:MAG: phosphatidylserine decarboxylase family protein [Desulfovibrionaceae bacterium]
MLKPSTGVAPEGYPCILFTAFAALLFAVVGCWPMAVILLVLDGFILNFFRDPERVPPEDPELAVSPADGRVVKVEPMLDPFTGEHRLSVCVFMNVFNVHVNRMAVSGRIERLRYHPGSFFNASLDKASEKNERLAIQVRGEGNKSFTMVQIAGLVARRIVCRAERGDKLKRGERFGMIRFGSRVDVHLPEGYEAVVSVGDKVTAGETAIARKTS